MPKYNRQRSNNHLNLEAEIVLDPNIQFSNPLSVHAFAPKSVFLTGATGFLGAYLLDELLRQTTADVYCLVRAQDAAAGKQRLEDRLKEFGIWDEQFHARIIPVVGDLSAPLLGLSQQQFDELGRRLDVIYHSGGWVNFFYPYAKLKPTNVLGTHEVLRLGAIDQTKPVHFISSMAIFLHEGHPAEKPLKETDIPRYDPSLKGGYKQSKWVADRLVISAQKRGLPASIYRPSRIIGHSQSGVTGDVHDPFNTFLKGCILLGKYPDSAIALELAPVDYVSQAIVHLSQQPAVFGKAYHLSNPHPLSWSDIFATVRSFGYPLEGMAYQAWWDELKAVARTNSLQKRFLTQVRLILSSKNNNFFVERPLFDGRQALEGLAGSQITCPPVKELIPASLSYLQRSGFLS